MKLAIMPLVALGLLMSVPAGAQHVAPGVDSPRGDNLPRTRQERDLGLEGKPRGQEEQPAPNDDAYSTEEPDEDDDVVPGVPPASSRRF